MSATNHTSNYNLPIYEAGNTANWLVDFNGAMSTIDEALNENKLAGDTLKTDMEELQTDFQQVSTKADASETAATQASQNAANALTIANNATMIAGDAQVDAHAVLEAYNNSRKTLSWTDINTLIGGTDFTGHWTYQFNAFASNVSFDINFRPSGLAKLIKVNESMHIYRLPIALSSDNLNTLKSVHPWNDIISHNHSNYYYTLAYTYEHINETQKVKTTGIFIENESTIYKALSLINNDLTKECRGSCETGTFFYDKPLSPAKLNKNSPHIDFGFPFGFDCSKVTLEEIAPYFN